MRFSTCEPARAPRTPRAHHPLAAPRDARARGTPSLHEREGVRAKGSVASRDVESTTYVPRARVSRTSQKQKRSRACMTRAPLPVRTSLPSGAFTSSRTCGNARWRDGYTGRGARPRWLPNFLWTCPRIPIDPAPCCDPPPPPPPPRLPLAWPAVKTAWKCEPKRSSSPDLLLVRLLLVMVGLVHCRRGDGWFGYEVVVVLVNQLLNRKVVSGDRS